MPAHPFRHSGAGWDPALHPMQRKLDSGLRRNDEILIAEQP
jgi:hypothetical protein